MKVGFCGLLTIALLVLKVMGYISISWFWVFAPIWIPVVFVVFILLLAAIATASK